MKHFLKSTFAALLGTTLLVANAFADEEEKTGEDPFTDAGAEVDDDGEAENEDDTDNIDLNFINESGDTNNSEIVIFQPNDAEPEEGPPTDLDFINNTGDTNNSEVVIFQKNDAENDESDDDGDGEGLL